MLCQVVHGAVPPRFPSGTFFVIGPDAADPGECGPVRHPLDGNGRIQRVQFRAGEVRISSAHVETVHRRNERRAGRFLYRHTFGTGPQFGADLKNAANTNFFLHGSRGFALFEGSKPHEVDPDTLETKGESSLDGVVRAGMPMTTGCSPLDVLTGMGGEALCAHPRRDPVTGHSVVNPQRSFFSVLSSANVSEQSIPYPSSSASSLERGVDVYTRACTCLSFVLAKHHSPTFWSGR